jgi:hypothetical protein
LYNTIASGGESLANVCLRISRVIQTLHRECSDKRVVMVCHGEVMWAFRVILENISQSKYRELDTKKDPMDKIHNCQIIHYTRRDPYSNKLHDKMHWMRSLCPWDLSKSQNNWLKFDAPLLKNEDLLAIVNRVPRVLTNTSPSPISVDYIDEEYPNSRGSSRTFGTPEKSPTRKGSNVISLPSVQRSPQEAFSPNNAYKANMSSQVGSVMGVSDDNITPTRLKTSVRVRGETQRNYNILFPD